MPVAAGNTADGVGGGGGVLGSTSGWNTSVASGIGNDTSLGAFGDGGGMDVWGAGFGLGYHDGGADLSNSFSPLGAQSFQSQSIGSSGFTPQQYMQYPTQVTPAVAAPFPAPAALPMAAYAPSQQLHMQQFGAPSGAQPCQILNGSYPSQQPVFVRHLHVHQHQLPPQLQTLFAAVSPQTIAAGLAALAQQSLFPRCSGHSGVNAAGVGGVGATGLHPGEQSNRSESPPTVSVSFRTPRGGYGAWKLFYEGGNGITALKDWSTAEANAKTADETEAGAGKKSALGQRYRKVKRIALIYDNYQTASSVAEFERLYGSLNTNFSQLYAAIARDFPDKVARSTSRISQTRLLLQSAAPRGPEPRKRSEARRAGTQARREAGVVQGGAEEGDEDKDEDEDEHANGMGGPAARWGAPLDDKYGYGGSVDERDDEYMTADERRGYTGEAWD
ncbi:hypothetical protein HDU93_003865 [Gonapodya sp. JEL0774]|nr:hypothetical protein HDU93_003865 [Gonapodya sp. JEL0774]